MRKYLLISLIILFISPAFAAKADLVDDLIKKDTSSIFKFKIKLCHLFKIMIG